MGATVVDVIIVIIPTGGTSTTQPTTACVEILIGQGDGTSRTGGWHWPLCIAEGDHPGDLAALKAARDAAITAAQTSAAAWEDYLDGLPALPGGTTPAQSGADWWAQIPASWREQVRIRVAQAGALS